MHRERCQKAKCRRLCPPIPSGMQTALPLCWSLPRHVQAAPVSPTASLLSCKKILLLSATYHWEVFPSKLSKQGETQYTSWINEAWRGVFYTSFEVGELFNILWENTVEEVIWRKGILWIHPWFCCISRSVKKSMCRGFQQKAQHMDWLKDVEGGSKPLLQMWMEKTVLADVQEGSCKYVLAAVCLKCLSFDPQLDKERSCRLESLWNFVLIKDRYSKNYRTGMRNEASLRR